MIILTGGAGFVGSNILRKLNELGETDILIVDNLKHGDKYRNLVGAKFKDYISKSAFRERLRGGSIGPDIRAICHQGACTDTMEYDGEYMLSNNFEYSKELLIFALLHKVPFVYASSAATYGHAEIAREDDGNEAPLNVYGYSKLLFDQYVCREVIGAESTVVGLRYFNVYGPREGHKGKMASMVYQLTNQVRETGVAKLFGAIGKYGPGEQRRDFIYVKDLVDINLHFLRGPLRNAIVNAGCGETKTFNDLANAVIAKLGKGKIEYVDFPPSLVDKYQFNTTADISKLRQLGYDKPFWSLNDGVADYIDEMEAVNRPFSAVTS